MTEPVCRDEDMLLTLALRAVTVVAALALLALVLALHGCAPSRAPRPTIAADPVGLTPSEQASLVADVTSAARSFPWLAGYSIRVEPWPLRFDPPLATGFGLVSTATSETDLAGHVVTLTWQRRPDGSLDVEDLPYEAANVRCGCESGLPK